jgi:hypothetical protein
MVGRRWPQPSLSIPCAVVPPSGEWGRRRLCSAWPGMSAGGMDRFLPQPPNNRMRFGAIPEPEASTHLAQPSTALPVPIPR